MPKAKRRAIAKGQMETRSKSAARGKGATSSEKTPKRKPTLKAKKGARSKDDEKSKIRVVIPKTSRSPPFFFSADPDSEGGFLSPWYTCSFKYGDRSCTSVGQFISACRAEIARDVESYEKILAATSEEEIKALADNIKDFPMEKWVNHPDYTEHIYDANLNKFLHSDQSEDLLNRLAKLGDRELVFADPLDIYLGIGLSTEEATKTADRESWGRNEHGKSFERLREEIRNPYSPKLFSHPWDTMW